MNIAYNIYLVTDRDASSRIISIYREKNQKG